MRYFIEIDTDNAAFEDATGPEVARILREIAERVEGYSFDEQNAGVRFPVRDVNGNRCGTHGYTDE